MDRGEGELLELPKDPLNRKESTKLVGQIDLNVHPICCLLLHLSLLFWYVNFSYHSLRPPCREMPLVSFFCWIFMPVDLICFPRFGRARTLKECVKLLKLLLLQQQQHYRHSVSNQSMAKRRPTDGGAKEGSHVNTNGQPPSHFFFDFSLTLSVILSVGERKEKWSNNDYFDAEFNLPRITSPTDRPGQERLTGWGRNQHLQCLSLLPPVIINSRRRRLWLCGGVWIGLAFELRTSSSNMRWDSEKMNKNH